jgi:small conductance mechanosensitive channel
MLAAVEDWAPAIKVVVILVVAIILTIVARRLLTKRATALVARFGTVSTDPVREAGRVRTLSAVTQSATIGLIWVIAILAILQVINNAISSFVLAITLLGSALTFGAQSLIRDLLSGFFILLEDQYAVGDVVDLGPATGTVEKVTLRVTRIRDASGKVWWVPNGQIARAGNETQDWARAVVDVAVARESDVDAATTVLGEIAQRAVADPSLSSRILEPPRVVGIQQLTDAKVARHPDRGPGRVQGRPARAAPAGRDVPGRERLGHV